MQGGYILFPLTGRRSEEEVKSEDLPETYTEFLAEKEHHDSVDNRDIPDRILFFFFRFGIFLFPVTGDHMNIPHDDKLLIIGEALHILNPEFQQALEDQDVTALVRLAEQQIAAGAMALDINPGPARAMAALMPWVVETLQQHNSIPLFLPALSGDIEQTLQAHQGQATINAVTADPKHLGSTMTIARKFEANLVVLLTRPGLQHNDTAQRLQIALEVLEQADRAGLPFDQLFLDPVFSTRTDPVTWKLTGGMPELDQILETISLIGELSNHQVQTLLALSNGTLGLPARKRSSFHCRMLPLLIDAGLDGVICNCRDQALMKVAGTLSKPERLQQKAA
jgi:cobalamin-dependent methionine synthase I